MTPTTYEKIAAIARIQAWSQGLYIWCDRTQEKEIAAMCRADGLKVKRMTLPSHQVKLFAKY